jgi:hypothetical protein
MTSRVKCKVQPNSRPIGSAGAELCLGHAPRKQDDKAGWNVHTESAHRDEQIQCRLSIWTQDPHAGTDSPQ